MKINHAKTKAMSMHNKNKNTFTLQGIENVLKFTYLGSIVTKECGSMEDVRNRISKTNGTFNLVQ
jgi:hypothetical protein